ncbi:hypothetical protein ACRDNQ_03960 [Palleronia sp. KMU-117]|uniref:hypothetical protein n=1 Tax=Palleronia sp. KMU-117 TaxID=3434108 RepID=UPI003D7665D2
MANIKAGDVVESFQGRFAKVVGVTESGMVLLSAWHLKKVYAEDDTRAVTRLNAFGLSQVLKDGENAPETDAKPKAPKADGEKKDAKPKAPKAE